MKKSVKTIALLTLAALSQLSFAGNNEITESNYIKSKIAATKPLCGDKLRCGAPLLVAKFYQGHKYAPVWVDNDQISAEGLKLVEIIRNSYLDGLDPRNYHLPQIDSLLNELDDAEGKNRSKILANLDLALSDAFFLYSYNLHYGILSSKQLFPDWSIGPKPVDLIKSLNDSLEDNSLDEVVKKLAPQYKGYTLLKNKMNQYQQIAIHGGWQPIPADDDDVLQLGDKGDRVKALQQRLLISGELGGIDSKGKFDQDLQKAVIQFQENNGLYDDGIIESETLAALNKSAEYRIRQIEMNLDKMRWLPENLGSEYILVNIPEYSLNVIKDGKSTLTMDVAVGGVEHPSCILSSKITSVVLNPYWTMPTGIAVSELWPHLKTEKGFLAKKHVQVLKKDITGEFVPLNLDNPLYADKFNWNSMTAREFNSYRYRQDPGAANSLGKVKFLFANPCQIYLHDTNESEVFDIYRRDFSHGCIRVGEPQNLANYVLTKEDGWTKRKVAKSFKNGKDKSVTLTNPLNLYIVYFTSWVSNDDWVQFRHDIYSLDKPKKYTVYLPKKAETDDTEQKQ